MTPDPLRVFLITAALAVVGEGSSEVKEHVSSYSCCKSLEIKFDPRCQNTWSKGRTPFAVTQQHRECMSPCLRIEDGKMLLMEQECPNITHTTVCTEEGMLEEERTSYHGQPCTRSVKDEAAPSSQGGSHSGCVGLLLAVTQLII